MLIASMSEQCHIPNLKALKEDLKKWNEEEFDVANLERTKYPHF